MFYPRWSTASILELNNCNHPSNHDLYQAEYFSCPTKWEILSFIFMVLTKRFTLVMMVKLIYLMSHDLPLNSKMQFFNWPTHADELRVKRNSMSLSNNKFTFTIQALIGINVTYVIDVKQLYQEFCSFIFPINDDIWVHICFSQQSNFLQPWSTQVFYKLSKW